MPLFIKTKRLETSCNKPEQAGTSYNNLVRLEKTQKQLQKVEPGKVFYRGCLAFGKGLIMWATKARRGCKIRYRKIFLNKLDPYTKVIGSEAWD